jgi:hypothetical protein
LIRHPGWKKFGFEIRNGKNSDPGSGINIPDPQHFKSGSVKKKAILVETVATVEITGVSLFL